MSSPIEFLPISGSHREDLGGGVYVARHTASGGRRLDIGNGIEIVEGIMEPPPRDTIHHGGQAVPILSPWFTRIHEREEEEEDAHHDRKRARVPASSKAIQRLREVSAGDAAAAECAVCLQDFVAEDKLRAMPCSHTFHQHCIFSWLRVNHVCPLCRHALPTQHDDDDANWGMPGRGEA